MIGMSGLINDDDDDDAKWVRCGFHMSVKRDSRQRWLALFYPLLNWAGAEVRCYVVCDSFNRVRFFSPF